MPEVLIDLGPVRELSYIRDQRGHIAIGALTRHHDLEHSGVLARSVPLLAHAAGQVGDPQVRHRGTIGGSLAHSDPASDLPATILALDATLVARGPSGIREMAARPVQFRKPQIVGVAATLSEQTRILGPHHPRTQDAHPASIISVRSR
jgi:CO/xanthine dehydrogenase FAD-binding subunit